MRQIIVPFLFVLVGSTLTSLAVTAQVPTPMPNSAELRSQVDAQSRLLLGTLRQVRDNRLDGDPWGMGYSLQTARGILDALTLALRTPTPAAAKSKGKHPTGSKPKSKTLDAPLTERVDYAHHITGFLQSPGPNLRTMRVFIGNLDAKVELVRDQAEGAPLSATSRG
jgi:hypothetical protein